MRNYYPDVLNNVGVIYVHDVHPDDDYSPSPTPTQKPNQKGVININKETHRHDHHYPPGFGRGKYSRSTGLVIGFCGLGLSTFACYNYHRSAEAAVRQAEEATLTRIAAERALEETRLSRIAAEKSADISAMQAGLISRDDFYNRYPSSSDSLSNKCSPSAIDKHFPEIPTSSTK